MRAREREARNDNDDLQEPLPFLSLYLSRSQAMLVPSLASVAAVVLVPLGVQAAKPHPSTLVQPHAETVRRPVHQTCLLQVSSLTFCPY